MDKNTPDHKIKEHFDNRRISPLTNKWDNLEVLLTENQKVKKNKMQVLLSVAAGIVAIIAVCIWIILPETEKEANQTTAKYSDKATNITTPKSKHDFHEESGSNSFINNKNNDSHISGYVSSISHQKTDENNGQEAQNKEKEPINKEEITNDLSTVSKNNNIDKKNNKNTIADNIVIQNSTSLDINSDKLLQIAEAEIAAENVDVIQNKYGVDPQKLLREAENESNRTFLSKVFKSIHEKSGPVITAVLDRNLQKTK
ncbi:MAG: hypothetical protein IPO98_07715 [Saprospiraceae bacterium]|nr:hypothetical protein [Saprospiraceae bacterium]